MGTSTKNTSRSALVLAACIFALCLAPADFENGTGTLLSASIRSHGVLWAGC